MGLFDTTSSLWKPLVSGDLPSSSKGERDDIVTITVERDTRTKREEVNVETEAAMKEPVEGTELTDETTGEEADVKSHADDENTRDDAEMAADAIGETEPEDEVVGPEPKFESEIEVEVEIDGEPEVEGKPGLEDGDEESGGVEVEDEEPDDKTVSNADAPTVGRIRGISSAYAECLSGIDIETIVDLAAADADEIGDEIDVSPKHIRHWIGHVGDA